MSTSVTEEVKTAKPSPQKSSIPPLLRKLTPSTKPSQSSADTVVTPPPPPRAPQADDILRARLADVTVALGQFQKYFEGALSLYSTQSKGLLALATPASPAAKRDADPADTETPATPPPTPHVLAGLFNNIGKAASEEGEGFAILTKLLSTDLVPTFAKLTSGLQAQLLAFDKEMKPLGQSAYKSRLAHEVDVERLRKVVEAAESTTESREDPFLLRAACEQSTTFKIEQEKALATALATWQERIRLLESGSIDHAKHALKSWEEARSKQLTAVIAGEKAWYKDVPNMKADWKAIESQLSAMAEKGIAATSPEYANRGDARAGIIMEGSFERKKRFTAEWKTAYFILSASGHLHEYRDKEARQDKPHISLYLPACSISAPPPPAAATATEAPTDPEALFKSLSEDSQSKELTSFVVTGIRSVNGAVGFGHSERGRTFRFSNSSDSSQWLAALQKFTKAPVTRVGKGRQSQGAVQDLEAEGNPSDDEAFAEARKLSQEAAAAESPTSSPARGKTNILAKAKSIKFRKDKDNSSGDKTLPALPPKSASGEPSASGSNESEDKTPTSPETVDKSGKGKEKEEVPAAPEQSILSWITGGTAAAK